MKVEQTAANGGVKKFAYITITQNPSNTRQGYATFYQFGRKDALPGIDTTPDGSFNKNGGNDMSIQNGIQNPGTFYGYGSSWEYNPPASYTYNNLWSMDNTVTGYNDNAVVKTIYDPCPAGFHMPASNAFTGFTTTGDNSNTEFEFNVGGDWDMGWDFKGTGTNTVYFPALGVRRYDNGSLADVGIQGSAWSAGPKSHTYYCCGLNFAQWYVYPRYQGGRSVGWPVRPVSE